MFDAQNSRFQLDCVGLFGELGSKMEIKHGPVIPNQSLDSAKVFEFSQTDEIGNNANFGIRGFTT